MSLTSERRVTTFASLSAAAKRPHFVSNQVGFSGCGTAESNLRPVEFADTPVDATEGSKVNTLMLAK